MNPQFLWIGMDISRVIRLLPFIPIYRRVRLNESHIGWSSEAKAITTYTTTSSKNLTESKVTNSPVILDAGSVTTVLYDLK